MRIAHVVPVLAVALVPTSAADAVVVHVPLDHPTLAAAVAATAPGDSVVVAPGTYVTRNVVLDHDLVIRSSGGPDVTTLFGGDERILSTTEAVTGATRIEGFSFRQGATTESGGAMLLRGAPVVSGNRFQLNAAFDFGDPDGEGTGGAIAIVGAAVIKGNVFRDNYAQYQGGAIAVYASGGSPVLRDNLFLDNANASMYGDHVYVGDRSEPTLITGCTMVGGVGFTALSVNGAATVERSILVQEDGCAIHCYPGFPTGRDGRAGAEITVGCLAIESLPCADLPFDCGDGDPATIFEVDPLFCDPDADDYRLRPDSPVAPGATECGVIGYTGETCAAVGVSLDAASTPTLAVHPNPAGGTVTVRVLGTTPVSRVVVLDVSGREVRRLDVGGPRGAVRWDGRDTDGRELPAGRYFVRVIGGGATATRAVTLVR